MGDLISMGVEFLSSIGSSAGELGAGAGELAAGAGSSDLAGIVGTGEGLFGGTTGLAGTALAGGSGLAGDALLGAGADVLGTAHAFLDNPAASGLGSGAALSGGIDTGLLGSGAGSSGANTAADLARGTGVSSGFGTQTVSGLPSNVSNANAQASVFDTGTTGVTGVGASGQPAATNASAVSAPAGVTSATGVDPTAAAGGTNAASAGTGAGAVKTSSISDLLGKAGSGAINSITNNPLGIALGAGGLGYNILSGQKQTANQNALSATAKQAADNSTKLADQGAALEQYLTNGTLPPAYQSIVDQAIQDAKTTAISNAAQQGLPTDPTKNTALAATLAKIDSSRAGMQTQVANQLFQSGSGLVSQGQAAAGLSGNLYQALVQNDTTQAANTGKAIATLAAALNGKSSSSIGKTDISVNTNP